MRRYHVDAAQAERVRRLALTIYDALAPGREREDDADRLMLDWAARLAEIGLSIAHAQYHKHSAYILSNADMPGFSRMEQQRLARIVLAHRGKLGKMQDAGLEGSDWTLVFALRIAALVLRNRTDVALSDAARRGRQGRLRASTCRRPGWRRIRSPRPRSRPRAEHWEAVGLRFSVNSLSEKKVAQLRKAEAAARAGPARAPRAPPPAARRRARGWSSHHSAPFLIDQSAAAPATQRRGDAPEVRLVADHDHRALVRRASPLPRGCRSARRPGARRSEIL